MNVGADAYKISIIGELSDQDLEREFFHDYMAKNVKYIRPIMLAFGILNMLFMIPDYFFVEDPRALFDILVNRSVFLLLIIVFFFAITKLTNYRFLAFWITVYEILGSISFLMIFEQYHRPDFFVQAFGVIVIILVIFIAPNKWVNMLAASAFVSIAFFLFSKYSIKEIPVSEYSAGIVYILIVFSLSAMGSFRSNYYNRKQYIYSRELLKLSSTDGLTGVYNRAKWDLELERWLAYAKRYGVSLSVIFFDIDDFKNINDAFGHLAGDRVIIEIAEIVKNIIRKDDIFARWGGDEFMLLLPSTDQQQALNLAERLRASVADHRFEQVKRVTCSFGLAMAGEHDSADNLVNRTDQLLYQSKLKGKNRVTV